MGFSETIFLFFLALLIFGPKKLPEIARQIGKALNEFKRASNEFRSQIESEIANMEVQERREILPPAQRPIGVIAGSSTKAEIIASEPTLEANPAPAEPTNATIKALDA